MLDRIEYEYEYRDAEYEYEKKHEQSIGPKCSIGRFFDACKVSSSHSDSGILSCLASDFVVLVLSEAVLSATVLVLVGC
jgi:hypothetical protein